MKRRAWLFLVAALIMQGAGPPRESVASYLPKASHPRLFVSDADVASLRERCQGLSPYKEAYAALKSRVDGFSTPTTNRYLIGQQIQAIALVALVENNDPKYLTRLDQWLTNLFVSQGIVSLALAGDGGAIWGSAEIILGVAMSYDWFHPVLPSDKRTQYGAWLRDFQKAVITEQGGMTRDASRSDYSNQFYYFDGMLSVTGIALYGDGIDDPLAGSYLAVFDDSLHNHMIPVVNQVAGTNGGWHEGPGYVDRAMTYFAIELEAWRTGAGEDAFPAAAGLRRIGQWTLHTTQPDGFVVNAGDVSGWPVGWGPDTARRSALLAKRYGDGVSRYIAGTVDPLSSGNWPYLVAYLLWYDAGMAPADPARLDTAMRFDGIGWASMRSGWGPNDTFALFQSGNYYFGHQHFDQNSFVIFRKSPLAIDNGKYNVGAPGQKMATRFHNTVLVGNAGAESAIDDGDAGQRGASPMYYIPVPETSTSDKGDIVVFDTGADHVYVVGDASRAYSASRLTRYLRKLLYIRPDMFLVFDRVTVPTTVYPVKNLLQSDTAPEILAGEIRITNGGGRLFSRILLPADPNILSNGIFPGNPDYGGGNYRIEISAKAGGTENYFLNVLFAADAGVPSMPPTEMVTSASGNLVGAKVSNRVLLVSRNGAVDSSESYPAPGADPLRHVVADLAPNHSYDIYRDGNLVATKTTTPGGVLVFDSTGGGGFRIVRGGAVADPLPPSPPANLKVS